MIRALDLAKYIVTKCYNDGLPINNIQLQYILDEINCQYKYNKGYYLIADAREIEPFRVVYSSAYYYFCGWGVQYIMTKFDYDISGLDYYSRQLINVVIERCRKLDPWDMKWRLSDEE